MCMINEMNQRIKDLENKLRETESACAGFKAQRDGLEARVGLLVEVAKELINSQYIALDNIADDWEEDDMDDARGGVRYAEKIVEESPAQSLARIQACVFDSPAIHPRMKAGCIGEFSVNVEYVCPQCWNRQDDDCEICNGAADERGYYQSTLDVPWTTQKEIFKSMCAFKAAALREDPQS